MSGFVYMIFLKTILALGNSLSPVLYTNISSEGTVSETAAAGSKNTVSAHSNE